MSINIDRRIVEQNIYLIRGHKVMLDQNLAQLYGVETGALIRAVKRNAPRFPEDFMFHLSYQEISVLRCQIGTSKQGRGGRRYLPYAFTEQGIAMLSGVLQSPRAVAVNVEIMRAFVRLRSLLNSHEALAEQLQLLERKYDSQFKIVFDAIREIMNPEPLPTKRRIGFGNDKET